MNSNDIEDALRAPMPPNSEALTVQILGQIRDNLSAINRKQDKIGEDVSAINIRVIKLEEQDARLKRAETSIEKLDEKVDTLLRDKDNRDGARTVFVGIRGWTPVIIAILSAIASIATALYLAGRQVGVIQPSAAVQQEVRAAEHRAGAEPYPNDGRAR